jgi:hypothetical protein
LLDQVAAISPDNSRPVSQLVSFLAQIDGLCGQLAAALHGSETQLYAMLSLVVVAGFFAFRPEDPDQI